MMMKDIAIQGIVGALFGLAFIAPITVLLILLTVAVYSFISYNPKGE